MQGLKTTPTTPKKKILILNSEYPPIGGGAGTATANLARNLAAQGLDVKVVTARYDNLPALEQKMGFDLIRIATLRKRADRTNLGEQIHFILASFLYCLALAAGNRMSSGRFLVSQAASQHGCSKWFAEYHISSPCAAETCPVSGHTILKPFTR